MKTSNQPLPQACMRMLAIGVVFLSSCALPPRQAWDMIQREGLFNYWAYASGHRPLFVSRGSPPLMRSSLAYRPPYARYGEGWYHSRPSTMPQRYHASSYFSHGDHGPAYSSHRGTDTPRVATTKRSSSVKRGGSKPRTAPPKPRMVPTETEEGLELPINRSAANLPSAPSGSVPEISKKSAEPDTKPGDLPYGSAVAGRPNMVNSPYASKSQLVDVAGMSPGQTVKCPYSGKLFKVPPTQQAFNKAESKLNESVDKAPEKRDDKPKAEEKRP